MRYFVKLVFPIAAVQKARLSPVKPKVPLQRFGVIKSFVSDSISLSTAAIEFKIEAVKLAVKVGEVRLLIVGLLLNHERSIDESVSNVLSEVSLVNKIPKAADTVLLNAIEEMLRIAARDWAGIELPKVVYCEH